MPVDELIVSFTDHARARAEKRSVSLETVKREVRAADQAGRRQKAKPRWAWMPDTDRSKGVARKDGTFRYLINEDETRAYLCVKRHGGWRVVTILIRPEEGTV